MHGVAVAVEGRAELTYGAWDARSNAVARGLVARGVGVGDRVALLFDPSGWVDFAVAYRAVRKARAVAVLLSPGAARPDLLRALSHSGATGLLGVARLVPPGSRAWTAHPDDVGRGFDNGPVEPAPIEPEAPAALLYPAAPLSPPRPLACSDRDLAADVGVAAEGWLVHTWAPGSLAGQFLLARRGGGAASLAVFDPERLGRLVEGRGAVTLGLTPALAAAFLASGALRRHGLSSVRRVVLSGTPSPGLRASLEAAFPGAVIGEIGGPPAAGASLPPAAVSQEPMLWHEQFAPGSFNLPCLVRRYEGPLDVAALGRALSELIRRHQPLRSTFTLVDGAPRQVVHDDPVQLDVVDLSGREDGAAGLLADASGDPFDLVTGPLFKPCLVRLGPDDHLLVVRLHHTVFDDWSVDLFRRELSALYAAGVSGTPSPLAEPQVSFADFCRRQQARLASGPGADERAWWRKELDGAPLAVQLPIGPGSPQPGAPVRLDLPGPLVADLRALAPRLRATPFMTVLAAFSVLLARATGQDDLVLATVVAHRTASDVEPLVGCFTKKVPLRLRADGDPTFPELVARTRGSLLGALSHQGLAFDAAVQEGLGRPAADHGVVPQVAVVFQGETPRQANLSMPGLVTSRYQPPGDSRRERHFSAGAEEEAWGDGIYLGTFLILSLLESPEGMALVARGVFDRPQARRLLEDFQSLLVDVVAEPSRPISELRAGDPPRPAGEEVVELRGFRAGRSRLEAALARCPGVREVDLAVRDVDGQPRLFASVVPDGEATPTLAQLRRSLWAALPGAVWPADADVLGRDPDPDAALLAAMWAESSGKDVGPNSIYWQDFSFLGVLAEAREAGMAITDDQVVHCRTPAMLAAAMAAARPPQG